MDNATVEFNKNVRNYWIRNWAYNAFENYEYIKKEFEEGKAHCISVLPRVKNVPAIIIGSGYSLDEALPYLRFWEGGLFSSPSTARILDHWGVKPTYIMAVDTSEDVAEKLRGPDYTDTALLTHPCSDPKTIRSWTGAKYYFRMNEIEGEFIPHVLGVAYPNIKVPVLNSGCFANTAIVLAQMMGFSPIYLVGVDFGFPPDETGKPRERFHEVELKGKYVYKWKPKQYIDTSKPEMVEDLGTHLKSGKVSSERGIWTTETNLFYKRALMGIYKHYLPNLISCSKGILRELPRINVKDVIEYQGIGFDKLYKTPEEIGKIVDDYLIPRGQYAFRKEGNVIGMETIEGIEEQITLSEDRLNKLRHIKKIWSYKDDHWERKEKD